MNPDELKQRIAIQERKSERSWEYINVECRCPRSLSNFRATVSERDCESLDQAVYSVEMALSEHREDADHDVEPTVQVGFEPIVFEEPEVV